MADFKHLKADFKRLGESKELDSFMKDHKGAYFASAFMISNYDCLDAAPWSLEFYWPENGKVSTFVFDSKWKFTADEDILQKEKRVLEKLDLEKVKFDFDHALGKIKESLSKDFNGDSPFKLIVILCSSDSRPAWNITVFTSTFKLINFMVDAVSGDIASSRVENLLSFSKKS